MDTKGRSYTISCILLAIIVLAKAQEPVQLAVYYETLCPDSIRWVVEQLAITYPLLRDVMQVDIYPYGKATDISRPEGVGYAFVCQHGADECAGNKMLACAKNYIPDQPTYVEFNICVMSAGYPPTAGPDCAQQLGISFTEIDACSNSLEGEELLHLVGVATHSLDPKLNYVPWMVEGGEHTDYIQSQAERNLTAFVCSEYQGPAPVQCTGL